MVCGGFVSRLGTQRLRGSVVGGRGKRPRQGKLGCLPLYNLEQKKAVGTVQQAVQCFIMNVKKEYDGRGRR